MDTIDILSMNEGISEDELSRRLQDKGYSFASAEKLTVFVPSAFAWPVLKRLGLATFPDHFTAKNAAGEEVEIYIADQHYFTAALQLAFSTLENGWSESITRSTYERIAARSAEMNIVNRVYSEGGSVAGATLNPLLLGRISAESALDS